MEPKRLVARMRECLATDPRTNLLDVTVKVAQSHVHLIGEVPSAELRAACREVAEEMLPEDMTLVDELWIGKYNEPGRKETLG